MWLHENYGLMGVQAEYRFDEHEEGKKRRKWLFDYAIVSRKVAIEIEGGIYGYRNKDGHWEKSGAHSSPAGILRDIEKYNRAQLLGWIVIRTPPKQLMTGHTLDMVKAAVALQNRRGLL